MAPFPEFSSLSRGAYPTPAGASGGTYQVLVRDNFLGPDRADDLLLHVTEVSAAYEQATTLPLGTTHPEITRDYRRGWVFYSESEVVRRLVTDVHRVAACATELGSQIGETGDLDVHVTASNEGDYFRVHNDNGHPALAHRRLTFVFFLHRVPKPFQGGELAIYAGTDHHALRRRVLAAIQPVHNRLVIFPAALLHEMRVVSVPSRHFADSRFAVVGWFSAP
jgi:SM-20-related protein